MAPAGPTLLDGTGHPDTRAVTSLGSSGRSQLFFPPSSLPQGPGWRLDLYANTIAHERAKAALRRYAAAAAESSGANQASAGPWRRAGRAGQVLPARVPVSAWASGVASLV
jgi:hypothetical protein